MQLPLGSPSTGASANAPPSFSVRVMDKWSLSDKQVYGAEDDEEMDAIMAAIDATLDRDEGDKSHS